MVRHRQPDCAGLHLVTARFHRNLILIFEHGVLFERSFADVAENRTGIVENADQVGTKRSGSDGTEADNGIDVAGIETRGAGPRQNLSISRDSNFEAQTVAGLQSRRVFHRAGGHAAGPRWSFGNRTAARRRLEILAVYRFDASVVGQAAR